jgi:hypothetical protein
VKVAVQSVPASFGTTFLADEPIGTRKINPHRGKFSHLSDLVQSSIMYCDNFHERRRWI